MNKFLSIVEAILGWIAVISFVVRLIVFMPVLTIGLMVSVTIILIAESIKEACNKNKDK